MNSTSGLVRDRAQERLIIGMTSALTLVLWVFQSLHWGSILDGDSSIFSLMSTEVLKGHHFLYTAGQAHGGTPLIYVRALLFKLFGISHFAGFFINGIMVAASGALWAGFAFRLAGPLAALSVGLLVAVATKVFAQISLTDYYVLSLLTGGLMLNAAAMLAKRSELSAKAAFWLGGLTGFSFYICRFTPLYALLATAFYFALSPTTRLAVMLPTPRELYRTRGVKGIASKALLLAIAVNTLLIFPAFFTSDAFLGVNAEAALKLTVKLALALWLLHRWPLLIMSIRPLLFIAGAALGMLPHFAFQYVHPEHVDRTTGLVRWNDFAPLISDIPFNIGANFTRTAPFTYGLAGAVAAALLLALGFTGLDSNRKRWLKIGLAAGLLPPLASWVLIHTYMYFKVQYFYPAYLPLYLCLGFAVASSRWKAPALACLSVILLAGSVDLYSNFTAPNYRTTSGILELMQEWGVDKGSGEYDSSYETMWTYETAVTFEPLHNGRFPKLLEQIDSASRIAWVHHEGDLIPREKLAYTVLRTSKLNNGYTIELLSKTK